MIKIAIFLDILTDFCLLFFMALVVYDLCRIRENVGKLANVFIGAYKVNIIERHNDGKL